ncbi:hypothetical protein ACFLXU_06735 [Chloroflexota bacterium]
MKSRKSQYGSNVAVDKYLVFPDFPRIEERVRLIGPLKGSWHLMGIQYGEEAGDLIRWVFDAIWISAKDIISTFGRPHIIEDLHRYEQSIFYLCPGLIDFMKGIAEGASALLGKSPYANQCSDYEKIILINVASSLVRQNNHPPAFRHTEDGSARITNKIQRESIPPPVMSQPEGCSHFAVVGNLGGTRGDKTFHVHSRDTEFCPWNYNVIFVAVPDETDARPWWTLSMAGQLAGNMSGNALGVSVGSSAGPVPPLGETPLNERAFGMPISPFRAFAAAYASSAADAASFYMIGTESYRKQTSRQTLLRTFGNNEMFVDQKECLVVEATACRYGIRRPGDNGEIGNYIVATNHELCTETYDENNEKNDLPMTDFRGELQFPTSATRFWTLMWLIRKHFGNIDEPLSMEFMSSHFYYDKQGLKHYTYDLEPFGRVPAHNAAATVCHHKAGFPEPYIGGTNDVKLFSLSDKELYWVQGRPCEWLGPWDHLSLRAYVNQT